MTCAEFRAPTGEAGLAEIPPVNLRVLIEELHRLHARAGWPSTRTIARHQDFSHTSVEALTAIHRSITLGGGMTFDDGLALERRLAVALAGTTNSRKASPPS